MGTKVPVALLQGARFVTRISFKHSKGGRYRYAYVRIPSELRPLVEGRFFKPEAAGNRIVYRVSEPGPGCFKPVKYGNSLYIRLPLEKVEAEYVIVELLPDGFVVVLV